MGKKRENSNRSRSRRRNVREDSSDSDSVLNDASSTASTAQSNGHHTNGHGPTSGEELQTNGHSSNGPNKEKENGYEGEELEEIDDFEAKVELVLDQLQSSKSARSRLQHYESLGKALTTRFCFDYFDNRKVTMEDILEHSLKRADEEAGSAATTLSLLLITMGTSDFSNDIFRSLYAHLERLFLDPSAKATVRAKCAVALSLGCFITEFGMEKIRIHLSQLLTVAFTPVKGQADASIMNSLFTLKGTCLSCFTFLISIESDSCTVAHFESSLNQLTTCLESPNLTLRVAAGEAIALLLERCRQTDADYELAHSEEICQKLQNLATDSQKSRSKKDLREQRNSFRQILRTVEGDDDFGDEWIKIGTQERVAIDSWQSKRYYDTFCSVLGSGMNLHLAQNTLLRDIFSLGPVLLTEGQTAMAQRATKLEKQYINSVNRKIREIYRGKMRRMRVETEL